METDMKRLHCLCLALLGALLCACSTLPPPGVTPVAPFDLQRYLGKWYEIARLDHSFERGLSDIHAIYSVAEDGSVTVLNRGYNVARGSWRDATGRAVFTGEPTRGALKVSFFGPFYGGYNVIALDPAYRWAMVMGPDRSYFWILSRDKQLPEGVKADLLRQAAAAGVDTGKLIWVSHTRSDS
jgi:apolipoprotein D and lipocalin family protein